MLKGMHDFYFQINCQRTYNPEYTLKTTEMVLSQLKRLLKPCLCCMLYTQIPPCNRKPDGRSPQPVPVQDPAEDSRPLLWTEYIV